MAIILGDPGTVSRDDIMFLNFHHEHCSVPTNCPWVSEDAWPFYKGVLFLGVGSAAFGIRRGSKANTYITSVFGAAMASPCVVKDSAGKYFCIFEEACEEYLNRLWPDWKTSDRTYMFPPAFPFRYTAPTGAASGAVGLSKSEELDIKGDSAELRIFRALDKYGRETNQPMLVITKFQFQEFIDQVLLQNLPSEYVQSLFADLSEKDRSREIDFLIVHRRTGVILIEVKATEKFKTNRYLDAKRQLQVGEKFVQALLTAKDLDIPVYRVVAMPNVVDEGRSANDFIDLRKIHLGLTDDDEDDNLQHFEMWWKQHFTERSFEEEIEKLLSLISVFVGQRSAISATTQILSEVFKTIDEQSFLERSHAKMTRKGASGSPVVVRPADATSLRILAKQFVFLNMEQLGIWEGPLHQLFCGAPGSGKTILLQYKALECAKKNEMVLIMVPPPLDKLYKEFFTRNETANGMVTIVTFDRISTFLSRVLKMSMKPVHVFVDEFQILFSTNETLLGSFREFLVHCQGTSFYQWITYDIYQLLFVNRLFGMKQTNLDVSSFLNELCEKQNFTHASSLTTVMRCTSEVYDFLQRHMELSMGKQSGGTEFAQRYWNHPIYLGHHVCGPKVTLQGKISYMYGSNEERLVDCSKIIKNEINEWAKEEDGFSYHKVAILVATPEWIDDLSPSMTQEGIPVCRIGDGQNAVVLDYADYARSYEWPVVIAICGHLKSMQNYIPASRAVTRLLVLWWK